MVKTTEDALNKIGDRLDDITKSSHQRDVQFAELSKDIEQLNKSFKEHEEYHKKMYEEYKRANDILQSNTESLKEHIRRTNLLEDMVNSLDSRLTPIEREKIEKEAVRKHTQEQLKRWGKIVAVVAAAGGALAALKPFLLSLLSMI